MITTVNQHTPYCFGVFIEKLQQIFDIMYSWPPCQLCLKGQKPAAMFNNEVNLFSGSCPPVAKGRSGRHALAETAKVMADQGLEISTEFATLAETLGIVVAGEKDGQRRIYVKHLWGFNQPPVAVDTEGRYSHDNIGHFKQPDKAVCGGVTHPAIFCNVGLVKDVSRAQRQALHNPSEINKRATCDRSRKSRSR
jgi:hypothetical protein